MKKSRVLASLLAMVMLLAMLPGPLAKADSLNIDINIRDFGLVRTVFSDASSFHCEASDEMQLRYSTGVTDDCILTSFNGSMLECQSLTYTIYDRDPLHRLFIVGYNDFGADRLADNAVNVVVNGITLPCVNVDGGFSVYKNNRIAGLSVMLSNSPGGEILIYLSPEFLVTVDMFRLYNPNSGEHFYTSNEAERAELIALGWNDEGIGWIAPNMSSVPVYRLYNPIGGEHHYTTNAGERDSLIAAGWNDEGIGWFSNEHMGFYADEAQTMPRERYTEDSYLASIWVMAGWVDIGGGWYSGVIPMASLYRQYNPNAFANNHNYTTSIGENDTLVSYGWRAEGIGWYGVG